MAVSPRPSLLKRELQMKLHAAAGRQGRGRAAEAGRFEVADGDAEVRTVEEVEDLRAQHEAARLVEAECLNDGNVRVEVAARTEGVAADAPVLTQRRAQRGEVGRRQS